MTGSHDIASLAAGGPAGSFAVPAWIVGALGAVIVTLGIAYFVWRARQKPTRPRSSRPPRPLSEKR